MLASSSYLLVKAHADPVEIQDARVDPVDSTSYIGFPGMKTMLIKSPLETNALLPAAQLT